MRKDKRPSAEAVTAESRFVDRVRRMRLRAGSAPHGVDAHHEAGMATAEYAIATIAAVGFAGLLIVVLKSDTVRGLLTSLITSALSIG